MAVTEGKTSIIMTAAGDIIPHRVKITTIRAITSDTSGTFTLVDDLTGHVVWQRYILPIHDSDESYLASVHGWYDSLRLTEIPANAKMFIYYE